MAPLPPSKLKRPLGRSPSNGGSGGFTLVELLVVVAIIGALLAMLASSVQSASNHGKQITCLSNIRQVGEMVLRWSTENNGNLLPIWARTSPWGTKQEGEIWANVLNRQGYLEPNWQNKDKSIMRCPSREGNRPRLTVNFDAQMGLHYGMNPFPGFDARILLPGAPLKKLVAIPRPSQTFLLAEVKYAYQLPSDPASRVRIFPHPKEPEGLNLFFADGHATYWHGTLPDPKEPNTYPWY